MFSLYTRTISTFCWVKFAFRAAKPVEVKSLQVVMPLRDELASLFEVLRRDDKRAGPAPDFSLGRGEGEVWNSAQHAESKGWLSNMPAMIQPYIWFGGPFKGFCWLMESVRGLSLDNGVPAERIVRRGGAATLFCDLVNKPVEWSGETKSISVRLSGEVQTEVLKRRMAERFGLDVTFGAERTTSRS